MMFPRPTRQEERWLALANRYPVLHDAAESRANGWKTPSLLSRVLMFVLGLFAASLMTGSLLWIPGRWLVAGMAMVLTGEWLVRKRRLFEGGIEEALILCGAVAIVGFVVSLPNGGSDAGAALLFSLAVLAAGLRLGNAGFSTLAMLGLSLALGLLGGMGTNSAGRGEILALAFCAIVALMALVLSDRQWQRPSHDQMLDALVITMPAAAQCWALAEWSSPLRLAPPGIADPRALLPISLALTFAIVLAVVGVRRRTHAPLIGALLQLAFLGYELRELTGMPLYARMILWGSVLLALGFALDRGLRRPRRGITSAPLGARSRMDDLVQLYGAAQVAPTPGRSESAGFEGQGGDFGGGGASGRY